MRAMPPPPRRRRAELALLVVAAVLLAVVAGNNAQRSVAAAASAPVYDDAADDWAADAGYGYGVACTGTAAGPECAAVAARTRRELDGGGTIGYGALQRDQTPCSYRGASYYNCRPGAFANPYSRGCSAITQCRG